SLIESDGFFDISDQHLVLWQIGNGADSAKLSHRLVLIVSGAFVLAEDQCPFPKPERAVVLEGSHAAQYSFVHEKRHAPFQCFLNVRAGGMNQFPNVLQDWLCEVSGLGNVGIYPRVLCSHKITVGVGFIASGRGVVATENGESEKEDGVFVTDLNCVLAHRPSGSS